MGGEYWLVSLLSFFKLLHVKLILLRFLLLRFYFVHSVCRKPNLSRRNGSDTNTMNTDRHQSPHKAMLICTIMQGFIFLLISW